jgi:hypothetical protein
MRISVATNRRDGGAQASLYELAPRPGKALALRVVSLRSTIRRLSGDEADLGNWSHPRIYELPLVQHQCQLMQLLVAKALRLDRLHRGQDVVAIVAGTAVPLLHVSELICQR